MNATATYVDGVPTSGGSFKAAIDSGTSVRAFAFLSPSLFASEVCILIFVLSSHDLLQLTYLPVTVAAALFSQVPGASRSTHYSSQGVDAYIYPCTSTAKIAFSFDGSVNQYYLDAGDLNLGGSSYESGFCVSAVMGMDATSPYGNRVAILGDTFMKSWTTVFNYGPNYPAQESTVGFAAADGKSVGCPTGCVAHLLSCFSISLPSAQLC